MDLKEIKAVTDLMTKNGLSEFLLEKEGFKLHLKKEGSGIQAEGAGVSPASLGLTHSVPLQAFHGAVPLAGAVTGPVLQASHAAPAAAPAPAPVAEQPGKEIVSPMVGTFYRAPSPDSPPYVEVGQEVNEETVVCIIEAMKVMNEIKAEVRGVITEVLVENSKTVEFGKPLFRVK